MARILPVIFLLVSQGVLAAGIRCLPNTDLKVRDEGAGKSTFCVGRPVPCNGVDNMEYLEEEVDGKTYCRLFEGPAVFEASDKSRIEMSYQRGQFNGRSVSYSPTGQRLLEENFTQGKKQGRKTQWDRKTGTKILEENYVDNLRNGLRQTWDETGKLLSQVNYSLGNRNGVVTEYYPNGKKRSSSVARNGLLDGAYAEFYSTGKSRLLYKFVQGKLEGKARLWHRNGQLASEREYKDGALHGLFVQWDEKGEKESEAQYADGKFQKYLLAPEAGQRAIASTGLLTVVVPSCQEVAFAATVPFPKEGRCVKGDFDGNGHTDYVFPGVMGKTEVILLNHRQVLSRLTIPESDVEIYTTRSSEGSFDEPVTIRDGLVAHLEGVSKAYFYDFDDVKFVMKSYNAS